MVETLTERNLDLEEKVREMKETVIDLVSQRNVHGHEFHDKPLIVHLLKPDTHILYWVKCSGDFRSAIQEFQTSNPPLISLCHTFSLSTLKYI